MNLADSTTINNYKVWHEGNMGEGSGLDADKLDGLEGQEFLRSNAGSSLQDGQTLYIQGTVDFASIDGTLKIPVITS